MNALEIVAACIFTCFLTLLLCNFVYQRRINQAFKDGFREGRDAEWQDSLFAGIAKDRARREKNGQFKSTRKDA